MWIQTDSGLIPVELHGSEEHNRTEPVPTVFRWSDEILNQKRRLNPERRRRMFQCRNTCYGRSFLCCFSPPHTQNKVFFCLSRTFYASPLLFQFWPLMRDKNWTQNCLLGTLSSRLLSLACWASFVSPLVESATEMCKWSTFLRPLQRQNPPRLQIIRLLGSDHNKNENFTSKQEFKQNK